MADDGGPGGAGITKYVAPESNAINRRSKSGKPQSKFLSAFLDGKATE